jgi:hypothetical protein
MPEMACTGCYDRGYGYEFSSSTSSPESSGSEYNPFLVRKSQKKKKRKKKKKVQRKGKLGSAAKSKARTSEFCSYDTFVTIIYHLCCKGSWSVNLLFALFLLKVVKVIKLQQLLQRRKVIVNRDTPIVTLIHQYARVLARSPYGGGEHGHLPPVAAPAVTAETVAVPAMLAESVTVPSPAVAATPLTSFRNLAAAARGVEANVRHAGTKRSHGAYK